MLNWCQILCDVRCLVLSIIGLLGHCKSGNFNIHIMAWFDCLICLTRETKFYLFGRELRSCLDRTNARTLHENPDRLYSELTCINS